MSDETTPYPLTMQLPPDFVPQQVLMIAVDQAGQVRFDGVNHPFQYPALISHMVSKLTEALAGVLSSAPTVPMPPTPEDTHSPGHC